MTETQVVGHRWSARSFEVRDFLARNSVPYRWLVERRARGPAAAGGGGRVGHAGPARRDPRRRSPRRPGRRRAGGQGRPVDRRPTTDFYDVVIVGGGPAGLGAAVYAASEGLRTVLVERQATGGQAGQSSRIENYLGFPDGVTGTQLTDRARRQAQKFGAEILTTRDVVGLDVRGSARAVRFADGGEVVAHTVLLATGISYRKLDMPGRRRADRPRRLLRVGRDRGARRAPATRSTSSAAPTRPGRRRCSSRRHARRVTLLVRADDARAVDVVLPDPPDRRDPQHRGAARAPR